MTTPLTSAFELAPRSISPTVRTASTSPRVFLVVVVVVVVASSSPRLPHPSRRPSPSRRPVFDALGASSTRSSSASSRGGGVPRTAIAIARAVARAVVCRVPGFKSNRPSPTP